MRRLIIGSLLAAVAMFMWGFVFWVASPVPGSVMKSVPDTPAAQAALRSAFPESGAYFIPDPDLPEDQLTALHEAGPLAFVHYQAEGGPAMDPGVLISGFLHEWVVCFLLGWMLLRTRTPTYMTRVLFVGIAGVTAALFIDYGAVIWFSADRGFQIVNMFSNAMSWVVAGLVLAWMPGSEEMA